MAVLELSVRAFPNRSMFHTMLWLNPLFLVEGLGQLHPDLLGALLVTVGLMLARRSRAVGAGLAWSLATVAKLNFGLAAPWFLLSGTRSWPERMRRTLVLALTLVATATVLYIPFWRGPETVLGQLQGLRTNTFVPGGTLVDVVGTLAGGLSGSKVNTPVELFDPRQQDVRARAAQGAQLLAMLIALAAIIPLGLGLLRDLDEDRLALATGAFIVAMVTLASPKFQSWYLMTALPFFALCCPPEWRRWWVWAVGHLGGPGVRAGAAPLGLPLLALGAHHARQRGGVPALVPGPLLDARPARGAHPALASDPSRRSCCAACSHDRAVTAISVSVGFCHPEVGQQAPSVT